MRHAQRPSGFSKAGLAVFLAVVAGCGQTGAPNKGANAPSVAEMPSRAPSAPTSSPTPATPVDATIDGISARTLKLGVDDAPIDITFAFGSIWIADHHANTVTRIDPETLAVLARIPVGSGPGWFVVTDDAIWVSEQLGRGMSRVDPDTNTGEVRAAGMWPTCGRGVLAFGSIWQPACDAHQFMRIDPATKKARDVSAGEHNSLILAGDELIATSPAGLARFDPKVEKFEELGGPAGWLIGFDGDTVWVAGDEQVTRVRPSDGTPVATLPIRAVAMVLRADHAWLLSQDRALLEIDIATNETMRTIDLDFLEAGSITDAAGALWITNYDGSSVIRLEI